MTLVAHPGSVTGAVQASPSKSYTHRALLLGLLAEGATTVRAPLLSEDPRATLAAVEALGARATRRDDGSVLIESDGAVRAARDAIDCLNSGTTLRLVSAIAALAGDGATTLTGDASLRKRPMQPLADALAQLGAKVETTQGRAPLSVLGPLEGGDATLPSDVSSQFVSAILLAGARTSRGVRARTIGDLKSLPYVEITVEMMRDFGVTASIDAPDTFSVAGGQRYVAHDYTVPGDYSTAAFPLASGALAGDVRVENLPERTAQGDKRVVEHLQSFGALVERGARHARVRAAPLRGARIDLSDTPDLFPVLCAVAAHAQGETVLSGAAHLRFKESDRIRLMVENLQRCGVDAHEREDGAVIRGGKRVTPPRTPLVTEGDHRILMACAVLALRADTPLALDDDECYRVSYPGFLDDFRRLGQRIEVTQ